MLFSNFKDTTLDEWRLKKLPSEAAEIGSFGLSQEETIKFGQTDTDGTLYDIAKITLYEGSYISFEIGNLNTTFEVSEETANDLFEQKYEKHTAYRPRHYTSSLSESKAIPCKVTRRSLCGIALK